MTLSQVVWFWPNMAPPSVFVYGSVEAVKKMSDVLFGTRTIRIAKSRSKTPLMRAIDVFMAASAPAVEPPW